MRRELSSTKKNIFLLILTSVLVIVVFLITNLTIGKKLSAIKEENKQMEDKYETLKEYIVNQAQYIADTKQYNEESHAIIDTYEKTTTPASTLHRFEEYLGNNKIKTSSLSFGDPEQLANIIIQGDGASEQYLIQRTKWDFSYSAPYWDVVQFAELLNADRQNGHIRTVNLTADSSSGEVTGRFSVEKITINDNAEYEEPEIARVLGEETALTSIPGGSESSVTNGDGTISGSAGISETP